MNNEEQRLILRIREGDKSAYEKLFFTHYYPLCNYSYRYTGCAEMARDAVQDVFFKIWRSRKGFYVKRSLKSYLYRAVRNQSLKLSDKKQLHRMLADSYSESIHIQNLEHLLGEKKMSLHSNRLTTMIWQIVETMPEKRRQIFELHRREGLSYDEIADVLSIARKTVENHLARALQELREKLPSGPPYEESYH